MAGLITYIYEKTRRYYRYIFALLLFVIFISAAYYVYYKYFKPSLDAKKFLDVANAEDRKLIAEIYFFHADWCPHCKTAEPEWKKFVTDYDKKVINGYTVYCVDVNCTDDQGEVAVPSKIKDYNAVDNNGISLDTQTYEVATKSTPVKVENLIRNFNIDSYPTIKLQKDNYTIDFQSKITEASLSKFVNTVLTQ